MLVTLQWLDICQASSHRTPPSTRHHGLTTMLKHLTERCHETKAPSLAGTRTDSRLHCAALAAFASLYQSSHTPTRSHPSYQHALAARLACGKGPLPEYLPRLNLTIGPRDRALKRLWRRHRFICPRLALVGWVGLWVSLKRSV